MKISFINENNILEHKISYLLKDFFNKFSNLINFFLKEFSVVALDGENIVYILNNNKEQKFFIEAQIKEAFIFIIENMLNKKELKFYSKYELIKIATELGLDTGILFKSIGWQQGKKGEDYFSSLSNFSKNLKDLVLNEKVSINEAFNFNKIVGDKGEKFLQKLPLNLTFSEMNRVIQYFTEIYNKVKDIDKIIEKLDFSNKNSFLESIFNLRYSKYSYYKNRFENYIKALNLPKGVIINYDKNFETDNYQLVINFENRDKLLEKIKAILACLNKNIDKEDLFIDKNLFCKE